MRRLGLVLLFVVSLLVTLVVQTPLDRVQPWFPEILRNGERFTGNVARGSVIDLYTVNGLVDVAWSLRPSALFRGGLGADVEFEWDDAFEGEAEVALGFGPALSLRDVLVSGVARQFDKLVLPGILQFAGDIRVDLRSASLAQDQYGPADGVVEWKKASVIGQVALALGDIRLALSEVEGETVGEISNTGGDINLSGTLRLSPDGQYETDIVAVPAPGVDRNVVFTLQSIGSPESGDRYRIRESGSLADLG